MPNKRLFVAFAALVIAVAVQAQTGDLPRSTPAQQGISTLAVQRFADSLMALPETQLHHVMVVRHGHVVSEVHPAPFRAADAHTLYSASKTFVALAVGLAVADNRLRLDDRVAAIMHDMLPDTVGDALAQMTVRHLLTMSSGIKPDWVLRSKVDDWERAWLALPVNAPGEHLAYDSMTTFMLSAIVQRVTGKTVLQLLNERIFGPMHITEVDWQLSPSGVCTGGWGLRLQAESLAKVGVMMLQRGRWQDRQLLPEWWIDQMTQCHINYDDAAGQAPTDGNRGYGYQVWRCLWPTAYRADGALGQYLVMDPASDLVVVILGASRRGHGELACIWNQLMPGIDRPDMLDRKADRRLTKICARATLPLPTGKRQSSQVARADFELQPNKHGIDRTTLTEQDGAMAMRLCYNDGHNEVIPLGYGAWRYGQLVGQPPYSITARGRFGGLRHDYATAAAYAWASPTTLVVQVHYVNFVSATTMTFDTAQGTVTITDNFNPTRPEVVACTLVKQ